MAIVFNGISKCPICGELLNNDYVLFPNMISNVKDKLYLFSDDAVHIRCLNSHPLKDLALAFLQKNDDATRAYLESSDRQNAINLGLLTSDISEDLYRYNYLLLNKDELTMWANRDDFVKVASEFIHYGKWEELNPEHSHLENLIKQIKKTV